MVMKFPSFKHAAEARNARPEPKPQAEKASPNPSKADSAANLKTVFGLPKKQN